MESKVEVDFGKIKVAGIKDPLPFNTIRKKQHEKGTFYTLWLHCKNIAKEKRLPAIKKLNKLGMETSFLSNKDVVSVKFKAEDFPTDQIQVIRSRRVVTTSNPEKTENNIRMHFMNTGEMPDYIQSTVPVQKFTARKKSN